ncbi:MAG: N-methylproline demethylase, partial [Hyphomicrobiaceae bacterium]
PDLVVIATGGIPNLDWLPGHEHVTSAWDILSGTVPPGDDVLIVDGTGRHAALSAAEFCHRNGAQVRVTTIDETLAAEQAYSERVIWRKWVREAGVPVHYEEQLREVRSQGNELIAVLQSELTGDVTELPAGQVIFDYGTTPAADIFFDLKAASNNDGVTVLETLVAGIQQPAQTSTPAQGTRGFELHRIGDAISSRNIHSAVLDALRLCQFA